MPVPRWSDIESYSYWDYLGICERLLAILLLVLLSPLLVAIAIAILVLSGRSPLIAHRRVGRFGADLWVLKFRTMWPHRTAVAPLRTLLTVERIADDSGPDLKGPGDLRVVSRFARFCRKHSLDELPQLAHVATGDMALVGPRPVTRAEVERVFGPHAVEILRVKPGITGMWQVSGRNRLSDEERRRLDLECARRRSLRAYAGILIRTLPEMLNGANTW